MMEILKNDELSVIDHDGSSLVSHHMVNGHSNKVESVYEIIANVLRDSVESLNIEQLQSVFSSANMKELVLEKLNNAINKVETMCLIEEMKQNLLNSTFGVFSDFGKGRMNGNGGSAVSTLK